MNLSSVSFVASNAIQFSLPTSAKAIQTLKRMIRSSCFRSNILGFSNVFQALKNYISLILVPNHGLYVVEQVNRWFPLMTGIQHTLYYLLQFNEPL